MPFREDFLFYPFCVCVSCHIPTGNSIHLSIVFVLLFRTLQYFQRDFSFYKTCNKLKLLTFRTMVPSLWMGCAPWKERESDGNLETWEYFPPTMRRCLFFIVAYGWCAVRYPVVSLCIIYSENSIRRCKVSYELGTMKLCHLLRQIPDYQITLSAS